MAAIPQSLSHPARRSSSSSARQNLSHGRGGAGNIGSTPADLEPPTLETPTLKGEIYTTGRGGSGNMARNDDPEAARRAQDVVANPRRESGNSTHVGRGGAANVFHPSTLSSEEKDKAGWENAIDDASIHSEKVGETQAARKKERGLADKGKDFLFGKKH